MCLEPLLTKKAGTVKIIACEKHKINHGVFPTYMPVQCWFSSSKETPNRYEIKMRSFKRLCVKRENQAASPTNAKGQKPNGSNENEEIAPKTNAAINFIYIQPKAAMIRSILAPNPNSSFNLVILARDLGLIGSSMLISGIATSSAQPTSFGAMSA